MTAAERAERTAAADARCRSAYTRAAVPTDGTALVAVGGYGRGELAPYSDLDVVLVHADEVTLDEDAVTTLWQPLWQVTRLDHAVRPEAQMLSTAQADPRVALGLLDVRHVAGDPDLTHRVRAATVAAWRRQARSHLPRLRELVEARHRQAGEIAQAAIPDLKEGAGGLRDGCVLRALALTWLVDVAPTELEPLREELLDVRDLVQAAAGRMSDRIAPEHWPTLAERLGLADEVAAQRQVRLLGRRLARLSQRSWRRADDAVRVRRAGAPRRPQLEPRGRGVAVAGGEVVLSRVARPGDDPGLLFRAAATAAEHRLALAPSTLARLVRETPAVPEPWPPGVRSAFVHLLTAGPGLPPVWEALDDAGAVTRFLPEWARVRLLPHASEIHRHTVDRHLLETCVAASGLVRSVARPDLLLVAALLHDIGKGGLTEHCAAGEPLAREIAHRMGFLPADVATIALLVRWHLLLAQTATTRDPEDPATVRLLTEVVTTSDELDLLAALTEADAVATAPPAWTSWRARLVGDLVRRARAVLAAGPAAYVDSHHEVALPPTLGPDAVDIAVRRFDDDTLVRVIAPDRVGLLADVAATFGVLRLPVRSARVWSQGDHGVSEWVVADDQVTAGLVRDRYVAVAERRIDPASRLDRSAGGPPATVAVRPEASDDATVLEVRTGDRLGVVHVVAAALTDLDITVRSAHVTTLGPHAVDVFYVQELAAGRLSDVRAAAAAHAVRAALDHADRAPS